MFGGPLQKQRPLSIYLLIHLVKEIKKMTLMVRISENVPLLQCMDKLSVKSIEIK